MRKLFKQAHIWFSIPLGVVISITCFTGAVLIFEREITEAVQRDYYYVASVASEPLAVEEIIARVEPTLDEGRKITGVTISDDPERSYKVNINTPKHAAIFVNQYTGEVLGEPGRLEFFRDMFRLHRWLMDERPEDAEAVYWGKVIVGISTLLMTFAILSGIVIWFPRSLKSLKNRSKIAIRKGWHRFWYDLHVVGGIYAMLLLLAMALTGLTWSFEWYGKRFYSLLGVETAAGGQANVNREKKGGDRGDNVSPYLHWQDAIEAVETRCGDFTEMTVSKGAISVKREGWGNQRAADKYNFDSRTGEITDVVLYDDSDHSRKVRGWVYSIHVGNWGGIITRILWFLAAMLGATLPLTGYYLWIKRLFFRRKA